MGIYKFTDLHTGHVYQVQAANNLVAAIRLAAKLNMENGFPDYCINLLDHATSDIYSLMMFLPDGEQVTAHLYRARLSYNNSVTTKLVATRDGVETRTRLVDKKPTLIEVGKVVEQVPAEWLDNHRGIELTGCTERPQGAKRQSTETMPRLFDDAPIRIKTLPKINDDEQDRNTKKARKERQATGRRAERPKQAHKYAVQLDGKEPGRR